MTEKSDEVRRALSQQTDRIVDDLIQAAIDHRIVQAQEQLAEAVKGAERRVVARIEDLFQLTIDPEGRECAAISPNALTMLLANRGIPMTDEVVAAADKAFIPKRGGK
jgi:myo-inositol-hexaphosphate 3-phosphohydrolase